MELRRVLASDAAPLGVACGDNDGTLFVTADATHVQMYRAGDTEAAQSWSLKAEPLSHPLVQTSSGVLVGVRAGRNLVAWRTQRKLSLSERPGLTARVGKTVAALEPLHQQAGGVVVACSDGHVVVYDDSLLVRSRDTVTGTPIWTWSTPRGVVILCVDKPDASDTGRVLVLDVTGTRRVEFPVPVGLAAASSFAYDMASDTLCVVSQRQRTLRYISASGTSRVRHLGPSWDLTRGMHVLAVPGGHFALLGVAGARRHTCVSVCDAAHGVIVATHVFGREPGAPLAAWAAGDDVAVYTDAHALYLLSGSGMGQVSLAALLGREAGTAWHAYLGEWSLNDAPDSTEPGTVPGVMADVAEAFAAPGATSVQTEIRAALVRAAQHEHETLAKLLDRSATPTLAAFMKVFRPFVDMAAATVPPGAGVDAAAAASGNGQRSSGGKRHAENAAQRRAWHNLSPRFITLVTRRCVSQDGFDEPLMYLLNTNLVSLQQVPELVTTMLERHQLRALEAAFIHVHDLDEAALVASLEYLMRESRAGSRLQAHLRRRVKEDGRMHPVQDDSPLDVMLYMLLSYPRNDVLLAPALRALSVDDVLTLLATLTKWCVRHCLSLERPLREQARARIPSFAQTLDWLILVLDAHFAQIVLVPQAHDVLRALSSTLTRQLDLCERAEPLRGILATLTTGKSLPVPDVPDYSIELLTL